MNQKVAHELIILELLTLLLDQTTDDSVEVSVAVLKEGGALLSRVVPKGLAGIFDHLRRILNESQCDKRIAYMIEVLFQVCCVVNIRFIYIYLLTTCIFIS